MFAAISLAAVSCLCGSITHYAMGPAPIYFGAGYVSQTDWWKLGIIYAIINLTIWFTVGWTWWKVLGLW